jgi:Flp pilus assembly pilin Flp
MKTLIRIWHDERGDDLIEYALIAGFVAVAVGAAVPGISATVGSLIGRLASVFGR